MKTDYIFVSEEEYAKREKRFDKILKKNNVEAKCKMGDDKE